MQKYEVEGHESSLLPDGKWKLVWSDEFDGDTLDTTKWGFRRGIMHNWHKTYTDEGVEVKDGCVHIKLVEKDGHYYSAQLQTGSNFMDNPPEENGYGKFVWPIAKHEEQKFLHKYGYYECRCRTQQKGGWWSAFWLQSPIIGCSDDPGKAGVEVDIMESFEPGRMIPHFLHWGGYGAEHKEKFVTEHKTEFAPDRYSIPNHEEFHTFAVNWTPNGYDFYIDGVFDGHHDGPVSHTEQFILITTECDGYRYSDQPNELLKSAMPDEFIVDYVRVFDYIGE